MAKIVLSGRAPGFRRVGGTTGVTPGEKVLVLLQTSNSELFTKWQGPFVVTRRVEDLSDGVWGMDRGGACQIHLLNLLNSGMRWHRLS